MLDKNPAVSTIMIYHASDSLYSRMATPTEYFSLGTLAENASAAAFSASCDYFTEDCRILPVVMAEAKFREIQGQILLAHVVIRTHDATLEQGPKRIDVRGMDIAAHILALTMSHGFVVVVFIQQP